jgi:hypothetical protein
MTSTIDPELRSLIEGSSLFDEKWYRREFPDTGSRSDLVAQYLGNADQRPRSANALFDDGWYLASYEDVRVSGMHPLQHYIVAGASEGRRPSVWFDPEWYLSQPGSDGATPGTALEHFLLSDWPNSTSAHPLFDPCWYLDTYLDVAESGLNPLVHFAAWGAREMRNPNPWFDAAWYLAEYPDVASAGAAAFVHFATVGWREGRKPHPLFETTWYRERYGLAPEQDPLAHFLHGGQDSGHVSRPGDEPMLLVQRPRPTMHDPDSATRSFPSVGITVDVDETSTVFDSCPWRGGVDVVMSHAPIGGAPEESTPVAWRVSGEPTHRIVELTGTWIIDVDWLRWSLKASGTSAVAAPDELAACLNWMSDVQGRLPRSGADVLTASSAGSVDPDSLGLQAGDARASSGRAALVGRTRVLLVCRDATPGGAYAHVEQCARALQADGNGVLIVVVSGRPDVDPFVKFGLPYASLDDALGVTPGATALTPEGLFTREGAVAFSGAIQGFRPDLAIVASPECVDACRVLCHLDLPCVLVVDEDVAVSNGSGSWVSGSERALVAALRCSDEVIFGSEASRARWGLIGGVSRGRVLHRPADPPESEQHVEPGANAVWASEFLSILGLTLVLPRAVLVPRDWA